MMHIQNWPVRGLALCAALAWLAGCSPAAPVSQPAASTTTQAEAPEDVSDDVSVAQPEASPVAEPASEVQEEEVVVADASDADLTPDAPDSPVVEPTEPSEPAEPADDTTVLLGSPELTAGIAGEGPLTIEQLQAWLAQPENHLPLQVELPLGLQAGRDLVKIPDDNPLTRAKVELGRQLYFDTRLSADHTISCASCHHPDEGYTRHTQFGIGIGEQQGDRNSPVSYNRILSDEQFWDGRAGSLEEQAVGPIANAIEMGNTHETCVEALQGIEGYRLQFETIFQDEGLTIDTLGKAIASFERAIITGPSPYDYWEPLRVFEQTFAQDLEDLEGLKEEDPDLYEQYQELVAASQAHPISDSAKRGRELFFSDRVGCTACHTGANFTDEKYHNLGVGMEADEPDLGRFAVTGEEQDRGAFKTPTVRNVALSQPYMHDGSQQTLEEVVEWYAKGGHPNPHLSDKIKKIELTDQEKQDLVEFMKALTGEFPPVETARLPE